MCTHPPSAPHLKRAAYAPATCTPAAHVRSARSLSGAYDACIAVEWRMACATAFLRASSELASLSKKGDERAAQVLRREGHARLALEHGLDDLGPAPRGVEPSDVIVSPQHMPHLLARRRTLSTFSAAPERRGPFFHQMN